MTPRDFGFLMIDLAIEFELWGSADAYCPVKLIGTFDTVEELHAEYPNLNALGHWFILRKETTVAFRWHSGKGE